MDPQQRLLTARNAASSSSSSSSSSSCAFWLAVNKGYIRQWCFVLVTQVVASGVIGVQQTWAWSSSTRTSWQTASLVFASSVGLLGFIVNLLCVRTLLAGTMATIVGFLILGLGGFVTAIVWLADRDTASGPLITCLLLTLHLHACSQISWPLFKTCVEDRDVDWLQPIIPCECTTQGCNCLVRVPGSENL